MTDENFEALPPSVLDAVHRLYPGRPLTSKIWKRIAAYAGDDYRSNIADEHYHRLMELKVRYSVDGVTADLADDYNTLKIEYEKALLEASGDDPSKNKMSGLAASLAVLHTAEFVIAEIEHFADLLKAEFVLPFFESLILYHATQKTGIDYMQASPEIRSEVFQGMMSIASPAWEMVPKPLIHFVIDEFPGRIRVDPFWERVHRKVAPHFQPDLLDNELYRELLRIQLLCFGFGEPETELKPLVKTLNDQLGESASDGDPAYETIRRQLIDFSDSLRQEQSLLGRG